VFDPAAEDPDPVLHALHLEKTAMVDRTVALASIVGQTAQEFAASMQTRRADLNATMTVANFGDTAGNEFPALAPAEALYNKKDSQRSLS